ncbi:hypothetical protein FDO65_09730 [Nakamurella flava]|uniref:Glycoside hydrolase family 42 N-terminal domain-containing protein n=1 Tax=Nakamurella flava TaxID=2576308 RepID=A0A4U6QMY1_9ACTN|nr:hypothetical protein [Nakamurella flava]TKV61801.1 hypothetical protein FDO65_09730 [Nakamurella flava]
MVLLVLALAVGAAAVTGLFASMTPTDTAVHAPDARTPGTPLVGTLGTRPSTADREADNGVALGMVELRWADWETSPGAWNESYQRQITDQIDALHRAGLRVTLGLGLHYTPSWVRDRPFVDDHGNRSEQADFVFDARNRAAAEAFIGHAATVIDFSRLWAVRISSGSRSELMYPQGGTWWAFSPGALGTAARPDTVRANPFPDWRPGDGDGLSEPDRRRWYQWYLASLADTARWQMRMAQAHGFQGWFQVLTPGSGIRPSVRERIIEQGLPDGLGGEGVDWPEIYRLVAGFGPPGRVVAYVTSVGDDSGGNSGCQPGDRAVPLDADRADGWSSTRWIARIAAEHGFPVAGENPGYTASPEYQRQYRDDSDDGLLATTFRLAQECSFQSVYWAHDDQLWNGTVDRGQFFDLVRALPPEPTS